MYILLFFRQIYMASGYRKELEFMTKATNYALAVLVIAILTMVLVPLNTSAESNDTYRTAYYVKAGETLDTICRNYGLDTELVAAMNNIDPGLRFSQGRVIYLPREPEINYRIQEGDTLWSIAQKYRVDVNYLLSINKIGNPSGMQIGQVIRIPDSRTEELDSIHQVQLAGGKLQLQVASRSFGSFQMPVMGVISSGYGWRKSGYHHGTDFAAPKGTPIKAIKAGKVIFAGWRPIYGYTVTIDHGDDVKSVYGHASKLFVKKGQRVAQGQIIAKVGSTGRSTGPHLHLEIHIDGETVNPVRYLQKK